VATDKAVFSLVQLPCWLSGASPPSGSPEAGAILSHFLDGPGVSLRLCTAWPTQEIYKGRRWEKEMEEAEAMKGQPASLTTRSHPCTL